MSLSFAPLTLESARVVITLLRDFGIIGHTLPLDGRDINELATQLVDRALAAGCAFAMQVRGELVGMFGVEWVAPGVGASWLLLSEVARGDPWFTLRMRRSCPKLLRELGVRRLEVNMPSSRTSLQHRWLLTLGTRYEGIRAHPRYHGRDRAVARYVWSESGG